MKEFFAVFAVCPVDIDGQLKIAVTTRDGKDTGRIGLPGGKVDAGEHPRDALLRECAEEGFKFRLPVEAEPIHQAVVDGKLVGWFAAYDPVMLSHYKEQTRGITPGFADFVAVANSGYGNEWLLSAERALCRHADINGEV